MKRVNHDLYLANIDDSSLHLRTVNLFQDESFFLFPFFGKQNGTIFQCIANQFVKTKRMALLPF